MRAALIENGIVINVVEASEEWMLNMGAVPCDTAGPGWSYADGVFTPPIEVAVADVIAMPSLQEQLDALFEGGAKLAEMKNKLSLIKQKGNPNGAAQ